MNILEQLWAREQIRDRLHRYCKGVDRRDWPLVRSCFSDGHVEEYLTHTDWLVPNLQSFSLRDLTNC